VVAAIPLRPRARVACLTVLGIGIEFGRVVAARDPSLALPALLGGGLALCLLAVGTPPERLGLGRDRLPGRLLGGAALAVVLLLPAAVRWHGGPELSLGWSVAAMAVSVGEEVAFRGALFAAIEEVAGGPAAVVGSTLAWTVAHVLSHPPAFLPAVVGAGLVLGVWRWRFRDLIGPILAHVVADLAL
jgi:membrane protease YdiL (CAAX protease family)